MRLLNNNILVRPFKEKTCTQIQTVLDDEANKDKGPTDLMETKEVEEEVAYDIQKAKIIQVAPGIGGMEVGDIIYFPATLRMIPFEWIKNTFVMKPHDVIGVV